MMLQVVSGILTRRRTRGWLVGGSVRDRELGRYSPDLDLAVADDPAAVARDVAAGLGASWFALSERHGAYRVVGREGHVDVAALRGASIVDDLTQRDFTLNAMAMPLGGGELVDPFDGLAHLREARLVAVSERIFSDDPLRLMRAARFAHVLGLRLDASLAAAVRAQAPLLARAAAERVAAEIVLTLAAGRAADAARLWRDLRLLDVVLPEVLPERLAPTLVALTRLDEALARPAAWFPSAAGPLTERLRRPLDGAVTRPVALRLAALTHRLPAAEAEAAARRLKLSGQMVSLLRTVSQHLLTEGSASDGEGGLPDAKASDEKPATRAEIVFLWGAAPWEPEVLMLAAAAGIGPARRIMGLWAERAIGGVPSLPLDGETLMRELGLGSGPSVGRALREARLAWEAGEATTIPELLTVARSAIGVG